MSRVRDKMNSIIEIIDGKRKSGESIFWNDVKGMILEEWHYDENSAECEVIEDCLIMLLKKTKQLKLDSSGQFIPIKKQQKSWLRKWSLPLSLPKFPSTKPKLIAAAAAG